MVTLVFNWTEANLCPSAPYFRFCDCLYKAVYKQMNFNNYSLNISIQSAAQPWSLFTNLCLSPGKWKILRPAHQSGIGKGITCVSSTHCAALVITITERIPIFSRETAWSHFHLIHFMFYCAGNGTQPWNTVGLLGTKLTQGLSILTSCYTVTISYCHSICLKSSIYLIFGIYIQSVPGGMWNTSGECSLC